MHFVAGLTAALLLAALAPAAVEAALDQSVGLLPLAFGIALAHAVLLGLPLFLLLRWKRRVNAAWSIAGGFLVGMVPGAILTWPWRPGSGSSSSSNGVPTVVDGVPTLAGWIGYGETLTILGAFGALGGLVFWLTLKLSGALAAGEPVPAPGSRRGARATVGLALAAVALAALVFAIPAIRKDRTCHNMFRDGGSSISPQVNLDLALGFEDWPALTKRFEDFAAAHALSLRDSSRSQPGVVHVLGLSLCNDKGVNIAAHEQRWAAQNFEPLVAGSGISISAYELRPDSGWKDHMRGLVAALKATWPGKVRFRDRDGRVVPMPDDLRR
jgi:hypothetical protein